MRKDPSKNTELVSIVLAAQSGDHAALRALFDRFQHAVMGFCLMSASGDRDLAKDLVQDIFLRTFEQLDTLKHPERFSSWLWSIAHQICAKQGKNRQRYDVILEAFALEVEVMIKPTDKLRREHRIACVHEVLGQIADEQLYKIVELKYTEPEHTTRQIADILDIPHGTVTVSLMRFRKAIKRKLLVALAQQEGT